MNENEKQKQIFKTQLQTFARSLPEKITQCDRWTIRGFIDTYKNIYTISSDTKVISKILELHIFPHLIAFARDIGYTAEPPSQQNYYPDFTFTSQKDPRVKFAVDLKTTYRTPQKHDTCQGFTLGSHGEYFTDRNSTKNIQHPYKDYSGHFCLGIIYTRADRAQTDGTRLYTLDDLGNIPPVISAFTCFAEEKWKIASDKQGSGNTANIGSIRKISDLLAGNGTFARAGEQYFDDYWINFGKIEIDAGGTRKKITTFAEYLAYRNLPPELNNSDAQRRTKK